MFFTQIHQAMVEGVDLSLVIRKRADRLTVSVLPKSVSTKDSIRNDIVPLVIGGTPAELDAGFFASAFRPLQRTGGIIANIAEFERQAEKVAAESKQSKGRSSTNKAGGETKEETEKCERYEKALKRAEEHIAARSFDDALLSLQQARLYALPQQVKNIDEKIASVKTEMNRGSLFDIAPAAQQPSPEPAAAEQYAQSPQPVAPAMQQSGIQPWQQQAAGTQPVMPARPQHIVSQPTAPIQALTVVQNIYGNGYTNGEADDSQPMPMEASGGMPPYDNPDYPPAYRPEEYAEYPDFPQSMIAPQAGTQTNNNHQIF